MFKQVIDIGNIPEISLLDEGLDGRLAEALDIHGIPAHEIQDMVLQLGRAGRVLTLDICRIRLPDSFCSADGAFIANEERHCPIRAFFLHHFLDLGNDFP